MQKKINALALALLLVTRPAAALAPIPTGYPVTDIGHQMVDILIHTIQYARQGLQLTEAIATTKQLITTYQHWVHNVQTLGGLTTLVRDFRKLWREGTGLYYQVVRMGNTDWLARFENDLYGLGYFVMDGHDSVVGKDYLYEPEIYNRVERDAFWRDERFKKEEDLLQAISIEEEDFTDIDDRIGELRDEVNGLGDESELATAQAGVAQNQVLMTQLQYTNRNLHALRVEQAEDRRQKIEREDLARQQMLQDAEVLYKWEPKPWIAGSFLEDK